MSGRKGQSRKGSQKIPPSPVENTVHAATEEFAMLPSPSLGEDGLPTSKQATAPQAVDTTRAEIDKAAGGPEVQAPAGDNPETGHAIEGPLVVLLRGGAAAMILTLAFVSSLLSLLATGAQVLSSRGLVTLAILAIMVGVLVRFHARWRSFLLALCFPVLDKKEGEFRLYASSGILGCVFLCVAGCSVAGWLQPIAAKVVSATPEIEYARTFGLYQTLFALSPSGRQQIEDGGFSMFIEDVMPSQTFWGKSPYSKYGVVSHPVLSELPKPSSDGLSDMERRKFWTIVFGPDAKSMNPVLERDYKIRNTYVEGMPAAVRSELDHLNQRIEPYNQKLGTLLLAISWVGDVSRVSDVEILYKAVDVVPGSRVPASEVMKVISVAPPKVLRLASPRTTGQSLLFPVAVYERDADGYEKSYASRVAIPVCIRFKDGGDSKACAVRPPYRDQAAKLELPFGWYSQ
jgi:hypothetical protein